MNTTERTKLVATDSIANYSVQMAFESFERPNVKLSSDAMSKDKENRIFDFVNTMSDELIQSFSPEERFLVLNAIRINCESALKKTVYNLVEELENRTNQINILQNIIY